MQPFVILRILGQLLMIFSITMLPAVGVGLFYNESDSVDSLAMAFLATLITGFLLWYPFRNYQSDLRLRDGFVIVVLFWTVLGLFGSIPFFLSML